MTRHKTIAVTDSRHGWAARVDIRIWPSVKLLWSNGIETKFSCEDLCGEFGKQVVLASAEHLERATALLPWATEAWVNHLGYVSLLEKHDDRQGGVWELVWNRSPKPGVSRSMRNTSISVTHEALCDLTALRAEVSRDQDHMVTYADVIAMLIEEHKKGTGIV